MTGVGGAPVVEAAMIWSSVCANPGYEVSMQAQSSMIVSPSANNPAMANAMAMR